MDKLEFINLITGPPHINYSLARSNHDPTNHDPSIPSELSMSYYVHHDENTISLQNNIDIAGVDSFFITQYSKTKNEIGQYTALLKGRVCSNLEVCFEYKTEKIHQMIVDSFINNKLLKVGRC